MTRRSRVVLSLALLLLAQCTADPFGTAATQQCSDNVSTRSSPGFSRMDEERAGTLLIVDGQESPISNRRYELPLSALGFAPTLVARAELDSEKLAGLRVLVVPQDQARRLSPAVVAAIADEVNKGLCVYTEGASELATALGVSFEPMTVEADSIVDASHPSIRIKWEQPEPVELARAKDMVVHAATQDGKPVLSSGHLGAGRWLIAGLALDAAEGFGYGRLPYFHEALIESFELRPLLSRPSLVAYLDWGLVYDQNPVSLAQDLWARGIREVHLSNWYALDRTQEFFDLFIRACHARGLLVFSWLELPMVGSDFWDAHPECRERTASGREAIVDWRKHIALEDPACMLLVKQELRQLLTRVPWDGVDVAELYFESPTGFDAVDLFTPLSDWVRKDFAQEQGVDPQELFDASSDNAREKRPELFDEFIEYRKRLCLQLNREIIGFVQSLAVGSLQTSPSVMVTLIDTQIDQTMGDLIGIDTEAFLRLQRELDFDLNIEDPFTLWSEGPDRYRTIARAYREKVAPHARLGVDINVVARLVTDVPHTKQTGLEFLTLLHEAARELDVTCLYAATTPYEFDFEYATVALAGAARARRTGPAQYDVDAPFGVLLHTTTEGRDVRVDGQRWPCVEPTGVLVPAGQHRVQVMEAVSADPTLRVVAVNGEIEGCSYTERGVEVRYDERRPVLIMLSEPVESVLLDGEPIDTPLDDACSGASVYLPRGKHVVTLDAK